jgi:hypothetical protein
MELETYTWYNNCMYYEKYTKLNIALSRSM